MSTFDKKLSGLARTQRRPLLTRPNILAEGMTDDIICDRLRDGRMHEAQKGVYALGPPLTDWRARLHAAVLAAGPGAAASRRAAAMLHQLDGVSGELIEINVPYSTAPVPLNAIVHRTRRTEPLSLIDGIPTTGVECTLLELGAGVPLIVVEKALASAIRTRRTTLARCVAYVVEHGGRGRTGTTKLKRAIARYSDGSPPPGSAGEAAFYSFLDDHFIDRPVRQHRIDLPTGDAALIGFAWPLRKKALEFDGLASRADPAAHDLELIRQNGILALGWDLRRFGPRALARRPAQTYREIASWLATQFVL